MSAPQKKICVIGFGAVGQAILRLFRVTNGRGLLSQFSSINFYAPEIEEASKEGMFTFNKIPMIDRENLIPVLDSVRAARDTGASNCTRPRLHGFSEHPSFQQARVRLPEMPAPRRGSFRRRARRAFRSGTLTRFPPLLSPRARSPLPRAVRPRPWRHHHGAGHPPRHPDRLEGGACSRWAGAKVDARENERNPDRPPSNPPPSHPPSSPVSPHRSSPAAATL
jgi:hypothetical protein